MTISIDFQTVLSSAIAAAESSVSVILVLFYGYVSNKTGLLTNNGERAISRLCVNLFLPSLLLTTMGSHISLETLISCWPLVALPTFMMCATYAIGLAIVRLFNQPVYILPGMVFNNVTSLPLLLLAAISQSKVLNPLLHENESVSQAIVRAKAFVLLHSIIHNLGRFAFGPVMLRSTTSQTISQNASLLGDERGIAKPAISERTSLFSAKYSGAQDDSATNNYGAASSQSSEASGSSPATTVVVVPDQPSASEEDEYFYKRARQLSRKSIDFDETRTLLSRYLPQNDDSTPKPASRRPSRPASSTTTPVLAAIPAEDPQQQSQQPQQPSVSFSEEVAPEDPISDASSSSSSSSEEEPRSFYSILPQSVIDILENLKPAKDTRTYRAWKFISQFLNPAVVAAIAAIIIGVTKSLHWFFFQYSVIATSFTPSVTNIGELYPALQLFALGSKLTTTPEIPPRKSTIFWISIVRFAVAPLLSIAIVVSMIRFAPAEFWPRDRMLNFILMIVPVGPPAITLAAVAEIAGVSRQEVSAISRMLLYMYIVTPLVAPTVAIALSIAYTI